MNIVCVICSDLLTPSEDVFHTPCGHIFHYPCLIQWLERSKTCPQCREKTTEAKIHRIYFNFSNNDTIKEDATCLQQKLDNLTFQVRLKDKNISNLTESNEKLEKMTTGLRQEVRKIESEMNGKNSAIHALKEQIKFYKQRCLDTESYVRENECLKKRLDNLKNIQNLIDLSIDEVDDAIMMTSDCSKLVTYISVLKRELAVMSRKSKEIREKYKKLHLENLNISTENKMLVEERVKRRELEKQVINCESEKIALQTQLLEMQKEERKCICNKASKISLESQDSLQVEHDRKSDIAINDSVLDLEHSLKLEKDDNWINSSNTENFQRSVPIKSSYYLVKNGIKRQASNNSLQVPPILMKKSRFNQPTQKTASGSGMSFDGFGGHAKYDQFPNPISSSHVKKIREIREIRDALKTKQLKLNAGNNQSLIDLLMIYDI